MHLFLGVAQEENVGANWGHQSVAVVSLTLPYAHGALSCPCLTGPRWLCGHSPSRSPGSPSVPFLPLYCRSQREPAATAGLAPPRCWDL